MTDQPSKSLQTDWTKDEAGNEFRQDEIGVRVYRMKAVDRIIPLGQYFPTELYKKHRAARLEDFDASYDKRLSDPKKYAIGYVNRFEEIRGEGKGYYLHSNKPGSGKTFLGCCILAELSRRYEVTTQVMTSIDFLTRLRETFDNPDTSEAAVLNPMLAVDVLLLDDCGAERHAKKEGQQTSWTEEKFYHVIDSRLNAGKPTFFTSNYSVGSLPYHDRIKSRINAITAQIPMPEKDIRGIAAAQAEKEFLNTIIEQ